MNPLALLALACVPNLGASPEAGDKALRPVLSGPTQAVDSQDGDFRVHYTEQGADAPGGLDDSDNDGIPDVVERVLGALEMGRDAYLERGYTPLLPDTGLEGSEAIDVYLMDIDANGYAWVEPALGDPLRGSSCFVELNGAMGSSSDAMLESVTVHELHHCVEFAHSSSFSSWILEATATYEQYRLVDSPALSLARDVLWYTRLQGMGHSLSFFGSRFEYSGMVFLKFWEEQDGADGATGPELWQALGEFGADWSGALEQESQALLGQSFGDTFLDFASWNRFACGGDDGQHYGALVPCTSSASVPIENADGDVLGIGFDEGPFSAQYFNLDPAGDDRPFAFDCSVQAGEARVRLIAVDAAGRAGEEAQSESLAPRLLYPVDPEGELALVVVSLGTEPAQLSCTAQRVEALEGLLPQGCGCRVIPGRSPRPSALAWAALALFLLRRRLRKSPAAQSSSSPLPVRSGRRRRLPHPPPLRGSCRRSYRGRPEDRG